MVVAAFCIGILANQPIIVVCSNGKTFSAFLNNTGKNFVLEGEVLRSGDDSFDLNGRHLTDPAKSLLRIHAYQEFWHSWKTFHPNTGIYPE